MRKRIVCILLTLIMLVSLVPMAAVTASAASSMNTSEDAIKILKQMEGYRKYAYQDNSQWSIGYGSSCGQSEYPNGITEAQADELLRAEIEKIEKTLNSFIDRYSLTLTQNKFDALVLFSYNVGTGWTSADGRFRQSVIDGDTGNDFLYTITLWSNINRTPSEGLIKRRLAEADMYLNGSYVTTGKQRSNYTYVLLDNNGGFNDDEVQGYDSNVLTTVEPVPTYTGYRFMGWYTEKTGGTWVTALNADTAGKTLYAHWQKDEGTVGTDGAIQGTEISYSRPASAAASLNVYETPGSSAKVIDTLTAAETMEIVAEYVDSTSNKWGKLASGGWVNLGSATDPIYSGLSVEVTVTNTYVNVRSAAGAHNNKLGQVNKGDKLVITEVTTLDGNKWGKLSSGGWIALMYTDYEVALENAGSDSAEVIATGTVSCSTYLNVRSGAGVNYAHVGSLANGTAVKIYQITTVNGHDWGRIYSGWICLDYVILDQEVDDTPDTPETPEDEETGGLVVASGTVKVADILNVRSGPGVQYNKVGSLKNGQRVDMTEMTLVNGHVWGKIDIGWICLTYVTLDYIATPEEPEEPEETTPSEPEETTPSEPEETTPSEPEETTPSEPEETTPSEPEETTPSEPEVAMKTIYLDPLDAWADAGYTYQIGYMDYEEEKEVACPMTDADGDGIYQADVPESVLSFCFYFRVLNNGAQVAAFETALPRENNCYTVNAVSETTGVDGGWSVFTPAVEEPEETTPVIPDDPYFDPDATIMTIYLDPPDEWVDAGYTFVVENAIGGDRYTMTDPDGDGIYEADIPDYSMSPGFAFFAMENGAVVTGLTTPMPRENNCYVVHSFSETTGVDGEWTVFTPAVEEPEETTPTEPETPKVSTGVVANTNVVNVREKAGCRNKIVTTLKRGDKVNVYEQITVDDAPWARIDQGWICMYYVQLDQTSSDEIVGSGDKVTATGTVNSNGALNIRSGPGTNYAKVGALVRGTKVEIYEQTKVNGILWGRIDKGWICLSYVVLNSTGTGNEQGQMGTVVRCFSALNIRSAPGTYNALVGTIRVNSRVEIYEIVDLNGQKWGRIDQGWVSMYYILLDSELPGYEAPETTPTEPEETTPTTEPEETTPSEPEETTPSEPEETTPSEPEETTPSEPEETTPSEPEETTPSEPEETTPSEPEETTPSEPEETTPSEPEETTPSEPEDEDVVIEYLTGTVVNAPTGLKIREGAGTGYDQVGTLANGTQVKIYYLEVVNGLAWGQVDEGWICLSYVDIDPISEEGIDVRITSKEVKPRVDAGYDQETVKGYDEDGNIVEVVYSSGTLVEIYETKQVGNATWGLTVYGWINYADTQNT